MQGVRRRVWRATAIVALIGGFNVATRTHADPASIMIWPIYPVIRSEERAAALWLENRGTRSVTVQIRVLAWQQEEYADRYEDQPATLIPSPPVATIDPGRRQLVRLTRLVATPAGQEAAYRVLIDELPDAQPERHTPQDGGLAAMGVKLRMRYSLPLFVYGPGLDPAAPSAADQSTPPSAASWRVVQHQADRWLEVTNHGRRHLRLSHVRFVEEITSFDFAPGLLGYVLPGATMRWKLPAAVPAGEDLALEARINGTPGRPIARR